MTGRHRRPEGGRPGRDFTELPPRPDAVTGEPFPPRAPKYRNSELAPEGNPVRDVRLLWKPASPPGMGPVLVWHRDSVKGQVFGYFIALVIAVVAVGIASLVLGNGLDMLGAPPLYPIILVGAWLMAGPLDFKTVSVGADWFQTGYRKRWYQRRVRQNYVKLYELVKVTGRYAGGGLELYLRDADGRGMYRRLDDLQPDRRTWDLVYNGILHSVAGGAETDKVSEKLLCLEDTPALRLRDDAQESGQ